MKCAFTWREKSLEELPEFPLVKKVTVVTIARYNFQEVFGLLHEYGFKGKTVHYFLDIFIILA